MPLSFDLPDLDDLEEIVSLEPASLLRGEPEPCPCSFSSFRSSLSSLSVSATGVDFSRSLYPCTKSVCALSDPSDDVTDFFLAYRSRSYRLFIKFARPIVSAVVSYKYNYFFITMSSGDLRSQARTYDGVYIGGT